MVDQTYSHGASTSLATQGMAAPDPLEMLSEAMGGRIRGSEALARRMKSKIAGVSDRDYLEGALAGDYGPGEKAWAIEVKKSSDPAYLGTEGRDLYDPMAEAAADRKMAEDLAERQRRESLADIMASQSALSASQRGGPVGATHQALMKEGTEAELGAAESAGQLAGQVARQMQELNDRLVMFYRSEGKEMDEANRLASMEARRMTLAHQQAQSEMITNIAGAGIGGVGAFGSEIIGSGAFGGGGGGASPGGGFAPQSQNRSGYGPSGYGY